MLPDYPSRQYPLKPLQGADKDAPVPHALPDLVAEWSASSHAASGVNCSGCHGGGPASQTSWNSKPDHTACASCHAQETGGFLSGKHGMRLAQRLPAMSPALARLPMRADAHDRELGCNSCHGSHSFDTRRAAVEACLGCHDDKHTLAYRSSVHFRLWQAELDGSAPDGSGVSCAGCHLPRIEHRDAQFDIKRTLVQHNQSDTLRPNEKMVRTVCLACHGLQFSLDALADEKLIEKNFAGPPRVRVRSLDLADQRRRDQEAQRRATHRTATEDVEDGDEATQ
jgi:formate-dependent nitrite reductase cytochrome c552 subunit